MHLFYVYCFYHWQVLAVPTWFHLRMRGSSEKMTRSSLVVTRHDRRGSCVVMAADGPASSLTAAKVRFVIIADNFYWHYSKPLLRYIDNVVVLTVTYHPRSNSAAACAVFSTVSLWVSVWVDLSLCVSKITLEPVIYHHKIFYGCKI